VDDGSLVMYAMTRRRRLLKVGWKMTLRDACRAAGGGAVGPDGKGDGLEVKGGCLTFVVVPKGEVERKWVEDVRASGYRIYAAITCLSTSGTPDRKPMQ
jgi:hypothetical protein